MNDFYDVVVVGGGPAGMSAGIYLKRANISHVVIEKAMFGGKVNTASDVDNFLGLKKTPGFELAIKEKEHADSVGVNFLSDEVTNISKENDLFAVSLRNSVIKTKSIIIATGIVNQKLNIKGEKEFAGKGVSYCVTCDGFFFRNKNALIYGNDSKVIDETLYLANICKTVYLCHNDELDVSSLRSKENIKLFENWKIKEIIGEEKVSGVIIYDNNLEQILQVDVVFPFGDEKIPFDFLDLEKKGKFIETNKYGETNMPGVFAAGDVANNPLKQISTSIADGAICATSAIKYLRGTK